MRSKLIIGTATLFALVSLQACAPKSQEDCGYVQNSYGERISWNQDLPVRMHIHSSVPEEYVEAIRAAARNWNQGSGRTVIVIADERVDGEPATRDRRNVISFANTWESSRMAEQAKTSVHWVGDQIQEADIRVNNARRSDGQAAYRFYWEKAPGSGVNLEALVIHEMGHVLGLKHKDEGGSVMATYLPENADRTDLAQTDLSSLRCEY